MTKSTKHKKEYRKEKNKIKLKLTARAAKPKIGRHKKTISHKTQFRPKGLNVTDTSFKSKKIVLPENFRSEEGSGVPVTPGRKQSFKVHPIKISEMLNYIFILLNKLIGTGFTYGPFQHHN